MKFLGDFVCKQIHTHMHILVFFLLISGYSSSPHRGSFIKAPYRGGFKKTILSDSEGILRDFVHIHMHILVFSPTDMGMLHKAPKDL